jgi:alpha-D-xyloside xylohydrolase
MRGHLIALGLVVMAVPLAGASCSRSGPSSGPPPADDASSDAAAPACPVADAAASVAAPAIHTPRWAFEPWLSKDYSSTDDTEGFVAGAIQRGIPVGVAVLDSPWESNYNTFLPDDKPTRYHDFPTLVSSLAAKGVRTVVWITQFVNTLSYDLEIGAMTSYAMPSPNYPEGAACGYFVNEGALFNWYKGEGASLDFFNPAALAWWHAQQDWVLAQGIAGYKVDFGDAYVSTDPVVTAMGPVAHQAYSEEYYRDLLAYAASKVGPDFATMVRGWDVSYSFPPRTYARPEDAPVVWAGDNRRDWVGVADALNTTFMSASLGYVVLGSDIGGYLDHDDQNLLGPAIPFDTLVFARWTAMGALSPLMQLHSRADVMPWTVPDHVPETVALYQYWATLHHELAPFFYSLSVESYAKRAPGIVVPIGAQSTWAGDFRYSLGSAFLVAPILDETGIRSVAFPAGASYYDWWAPLADPIAGGTTVMQDDSADREKYPLYVRSGAIVPMNVSTDVVPVGGSASAGQLTVLVYPSTTASSFVLYEDDDTTTSIGQRLSGATVTVTLARTVKPTLVRVRVDAKGGATAVRANGALEPVMADFATLAASSSGGWMAEASTRSVWVKLPPSTAPASVAITTAP